MPSVTEIAYMQYSRVQPSFKMARVQVSLHLTVELKSNFFEQLYPMQDYIHMMFDMSRHMVQVPSWAIP